ncbi:hypothetical protein JTE90_001243 [Oedothorax gibbosus]|uniref:Uncharacterized protein n=1 Tax=Oedothorax gibbosus TaxID=931172 RepID=A0AAV6VW64_9ARAC|nr:hypothetical protein JTE90_001243 [Oedothorax gibbosus]
MNVGENESVLVRVANEGSRIMLLKRGWNWEKILSTPLPMIPLIHPISNEKKKDVNELLTTLFSTEWINDDSLSWYRNIVSNEAFPTSSENDECVKEIECDCLEDDCAIHI